MRFKDKHQRAFSFRDGEHQDKIRLVTGASKRAPPGESSDDFYQGLVEEGSVNIYKELADQFVAILETLKKRSSMGIQDDRVAWNASGQRREGGKVLIVDQADYGTQQIFFDDQANEGAHC